MIKRKESDAEPYVPPNLTHLAAPQTAFKFQRINEEKASGLVHGKAADHSFESKERFGEEGDKFGEWSFSKLKDTVGKGFKKEKNKMKNRNFHSQGARIGYGVNSVKF